VFFFLFLFSYYFSFPLSCSLADHESTRKFTNLPTAQGRPWYSLAAMPVAYQKENHNFCSQARYVIESPHKVAVTNFARDGGVDGPATGGPLCAVPSTESTSQLAVGPCFIPSALYVG
jgi:lipocalin